MNEYLKEKLRRIRQEADILIERAHELLAEVGGGTGAGREE
jgi:hypothetical protein